MLTGFLAFEIIPLNIGNHIGGKGHVPAYDISLIAFQREGLGITIHWMADDRCGTLIEVLRKKSPGACFFLIRAPVAQTVNRTPITSAVSVNSIIVPLQVHGAHLEFP